MVHNRHGAALGMAIVVALITGIAAYTVLIVAMSQAKQSGFQGARTRARYAVEAALVWANQQLSKDSTLTFSANPDITINDIPVDVTIATGCGTLPCKVTAKANY